MSKSIKRKGNSLSEQKKKTITILILCILLLGFVGTTLFLLFLQEEDNPNPLDYAPQGIEENQKRLWNDKRDKIDSEDGGGAINVTYNPTAMVDLSKEKVELYYANPRASNHNVAICIQIDDMIIAESDIIEMGYYIDTLNLVETAKEKLKVGEYEATVIIKAYNSVNGEKSMVDTKGQIVLSVVE